MRDVSIDAFCDTSICRFHKNKEKWFISFRRAARLMVALAANNYVVQKVRYWHERWHHTSSDRPHAGYSENESGDRAFFMGWRRTTVLYDNCTETCTSLVRAYVLWILQVSYREWDPTLDCIFFLSVSSFLVYDHLKHEDIYKNLCQLHDAVISTYLGYDWIPSLWPHSMLVHHTVN